MRTDRRVVAALCRALATGCLLTLSAGCARQPAIPEAPTARLAYYLLGEHAAEIAGGASGEVRLRIDAVYLDAWDLHAGLYLFANIKKPSRQWAHRLYRVIPGEEGRVVVETWRFREPDRNRGDEPLSPARVEETAAEAFQHRRGCDIWFEYRFDGTFYGEQTPRGECPSERADTAYLWVRKTIAPDRMLWLLQGFDENDQVLWRAEEGGYRFQRVDD